MIERLFMISVILLMPISLFPVAQLRRANADLTTIVVPSDFATIQEAINNAADGDTVFVNAGTYYEHVVVNKTVSLIGEDVNTTVIDGNGTGHVVHVLSSRVNVTGFTVRNGGSAQWPALDAGICLNRTADCNISGNRLIGNGFAAISLLDSQRNMITANNVSQSGWSGIHLMNSSHNTVSGNSLDGNIWGGINGHAESHYNNITDNVVINSVYGMFYNAAAYNNISRNNISTVNEGIWLQETVDHNNVAENNVFNSTIAIRLQDSADNTLRDNNLTDYVVGFNLTQYSTNNRLVNNTVTKGHVGIQLFSASQNNISSNWLAENNCSIQLIQSYNNRVSDNEIADNDISGVTLQYSSGNRFFHNNLLNNTMHVSISATASTNYWDDGYTSGGNFWDDYNGTDCRNGPSQNLIGCDGIGDTPNILNATNNRDNYPFMKPIPWHPDDIGVACLGKVGSQGVSPMKTVIGEGTLVHFSVFVMNYGNNTESFNITAHVNSTLLGTWTDITITSRGFAIANFTWDTASSEKGNYTINAQITAVAGETDTEDNTFICAIVVGVVGDVDNNRIVNMLDVYNIALRFGTMTGQANYVSNHDINDNNIVNMLDLYLAAIHYGQTNQ
jgi:parallel beta-helix repeat protein